MLKKLRKKTPDSVFSLRKNGVVTAIIFHLDDFELFRERYGIDLEDFQIKKAISALSERDTYLIAEKDGVKICVSRVVGKGKIIETMKAKREPVTFGTYQPRYINDGSH